MMQIQLSEPFASLWRYGYLQTHENLRKYVCLYNSQENRTIISYARYLMCVHLGYILPDDLEVDHINDDKTDDRIENLQLLTKEQNRTKQAYMFAMYEQEFIGLECAFCGNRFVLTPSEVNSRINLGVEYAFCSRSCAASFHHANNINKTKISDEIIERIRSMRGNGNSSCKIANELKISKTTVTKYWK